MMEEGQNQEEGWQAHDHRSGVAKVFALAKRRAVIGVWVAAGWAMAVLFYGIADILGVVAVAPAWWDLVAGLLTLLLAALAMSRTPGPFLGIAVLVVVDLGLLAFRLPTLLEFGTPGDSIGTAVRILLDPAALYFVLSGYIGCLAIQAFKAGFSPGNDWRTRLSPVMFQALIVTLSLLIVAVGVAGWFGAVSSGFAQAGVVWSAQNWGAKGTTMGVNTSVVGADDQGDGDEPLINFDFFSEDEATKDAAFVVPETAELIVSLKGLDSFTARAVEEGFEFGSETDQAGCLLEAQGRQDRCRDERCMYWSRVFARSCLPKSKPTPQFCDNVPAPTLRAAGATWAEKMCAGRNFEPCRELLFAVQGGCHRPSKAAAKPGAAGN